MKRFSFYEFSNLLNYGCCQLTVIPPWKIKNVSFRRKGHNPKWLDSLRLISIFNTRNTSDTIDALEKKEILIQRAISILIKEKPSGHIHLIDELLRVVGNITDAKHQKDAESAKLEITQKIHVAVNSENNLSPPHHRCEATLLSAPTILQAAIEVRKFQNMYGVKEVKVSPSTIVNLFTRLWSNRRQEDRPISEIFFYLCTMLQIRLPCDVRGLRNINQVINKVANDISQNNRRKQIMKISSHLQLPKIRDALMYSSSSKVLQADVGKLIKHQISDPKKRDLACSAAFEMLLSLNKELRKEKMLVTHCFDKWECTLSLVSIANPRILAKSIGTVHAETRAAIDAATTLACPMTAKEAHAILEKVTVRIENGKMMNLGHREVKVNRKIADSVSEILKYSELALNIINGTFVSAAGSPNWALAISFLCQGGLYDIAAPIVPFYHRDMSLFSLTPLCNIIPRELYCYIKQIDHCRKEISSDECVFRTLERWIEEHINPSLTSSDVHFLSEGAQIAAAEMLALMLERVATLLDSESPPRLQELNALKQLLYCLAFKVFNRIQIAAGERDLKYSAETSVKEQNIRNTKRDDILVTVKGERLYLKPIKKSSVSQTITFWQGVHSRRFVSLLVIVLLQYKGLLIYLHTADVIDPLLFRLQLLVSPMPFQNKTFTRASLWECPQEQMRALYVAAAPSLLKALQEREVHAAVLLSPQPIGMMPMGDSDGDKFCEYHSSPDDLLGIAALLNRRWPRTILFRHFLHKCVVLDTCIGYPHRYMTRINIVASGDYSRYVSAYFELISSILRSYAVLSECECLPSLDGTKSENISETHKETCCTETCDFLTPEECQLMNSEVNQIFLFKLQWRISQFFASGKSFQCLKCIATEPSSLLFCPHTKDVLIGILMERLINIT